MSYNAIFNFSFDELHYIFLDPSFNDNSKKFVKLYEESNREILYTIRELERLIMEGKINKTGTWSIEWYE